MKSDLMVLMIMAVALQPACLTEGALGKTYWGSWGNTDYCANGAHVTGFRLKVEQNQGGGDDTALNGIQFRCSNGQEISSKVGPWGAWYSWHRCPSGEYMKGVSFRSEPAQGSNADDTSGNNLKAYCSGGSWLYGDGLYWGSWDSSFCSRSYRICGLQTQVEDPQGRGDDTALNRIKVLCCQHEEKGC